MANTDINKLIGDVKEPLLRALVELEKRREVIEAERGEVMDQIRRIERTVRSIDPEALPSKTPPATRQNGGGDRNKKASSAAVNRVREYLLKHEDETVIQTDVVNGAGMQSSRVALAFRQLRANEEILFVGREGNKQFYRIDKDAVSKALKQERPEKAAAAA